MTIVMLYVKQVKCVVFLCLIRTTAIWQSYSVVIAVTEPQSESRSAFHPVTKQFRGKKRLKKSYLVLL